MKKLFVTFLCLFLTVAAYSQSYVQLNFAKGFGSLENAHDKESNLGVVLILDDVVYSLGGGAGVQLEYGYYVKDRLSLALNLTYQQVFAGYYNNVNGDVDQNYVSFNRKSIVAKVGYSLRKNTESIFEEFVVGGGVSYNIPGTYCRVTNVGEYEEEYDNTVGYLVNADFIFNLSRSRHLKLISGVAYRNIEYSPTANGSGVDFTFGLRKYLSSK